MSAPRCATTCFVLTGRCCITVAGFGDGYVGTSQDAHRAFALGKERERVMARANEEKQKLRLETAAYRLKDQDAKFSSSTNASEVLLVQQTVGLVTKDEFARRRMALEGVELPSDSTGADDGNVVAGAASGKEKKLKKKAPDKVAFYALLRVPQLQF